LLCSIFSENLKMAAPKDVHGFLDFQLKACGSRVKNFKTTF